MHLNLKPFLLLPFNSLITASYNLSNLCVHGQHLENAIRQTDRFIEKPEGEYYTVTKIFKLTWFFIVNYAHILFRASKPIKFFWRAFIQAWPFCSRAQAAGYKGTGIRTKGRDLAVCILPKHLQSLKWWPAPRAQAQTIVLISSLSCCCTEVPGAEAASRGGHQEGHGHKDDELVIIPPCFLNAANGCFLVDFSLLLEVLA